MKKILMFSLIVAIITVSIGVFLIEYNNNAIQMPNQEIQRNIIDGSRTFSGEQINVFSSLIGKITINPNIIPESPRDIRIYRGKFREGDLVEYYPGSTKPINNPVPEDEAPEVAQRILENYGGLPSDAQLLDSSILTIEKRNRTTGIVIKTIPYATFVSWNRKIDGMRVEGSSDIIQITLGENGTLIHLYKSWRSYESLGNVSIIPATKAIEKLIAGDLLNPISAQVSDVDIYNIHLSYYVKGVDEPEVTLEPIWVFYGTASGNSIPFYVYARQFANFTATPRTAQHR